MNETFEKIFPDLMLSEGEVYEDDPVDPGGATKYGITFDRLKLWRKKSITKNDVRQLTKEEAKQIYIEMYWNFMGCDKIPAGLDWTVFDFGVNSGPSRSVKYLQELIGADVDGSYGDQTHEYLMNYIVENGIESTIIKFNDKRRYFLKGLNTFWKYGKGWLLRVDRTEKKSLELANV